MTRFGLQLLRRHRDFIGNVATLLTGKAAGGVLALALTPVIARLFEPTHFGAAALLVAVATVLTFLTTLRFDQAVVLPADGECAQVLVWLALLVSFAAALVAAALLGLSALLGAGAPFATDLGSLVWLLPPALLLFGTVRAVESLALRARRFRALAGSDVAQAAGSGVSRIGLGLMLGSSAWGLAVGQLLGQLAKLALLLGAAHSRPSVSVLSWGALRRTLTDYRDFPVNNAPAEFVRALSQNLPVLLLGYLYSPAVIGFYAMAHRLLNMPLNTVATTVRRSYYQRAAAIYNDGGSLRSAFVKTTLTLVALGLPPLVTLWLGGGWVFAHVLGDGWRDAGRFAEILAPWLLALWISVPCAPTLLVLRRQQLWLRVQAAQLFLRLGAFALAFALSAPPEWTLHAFVVVSVAVQLAVIAITLHLVGRGSVAAMPVERTGPNPPSEHPA